MTDRAFEPADAVVGVAAADAASSPAAAPAPTANPADRWVLRSPTLERAQRIHSLVAVALPFALLLAGPLYLPSDIPWGLAVFSFALMGAIVGCLGISVGFHRHFAHRAFRAARWVRAAMIIAGQMAGQGPVLYWTALHRRHHSFSDRPGDPHSPVVEAQDRPRTAWQAFWHSHYRWASSHAVPMPVRYVADLLADPLVRRLNGLYHLCLLSGLALPAAIGALWTGSVDGAIVGFYFGGIVRMVVTTQTIWAINSVCHRFGSRDHDTDDHSRNNYWLAPLTFGECWHNNHHHAPTHARFGRGWTQPDPGWWTIRTLQAVGAVSHVLGENLSAAQRQHQQQS